MASLSEAALGSLVAMDRLRKEQDAVVRKINKIHSKLCQTAAEKAEKFGDKLWNRLRGFYQDAKTLSDQEESECNKFLKEIESLGGGGGGGGGQRKKPEWTEPRRKKSKGEDPSTTPPSSTRLNSPSHAPRWTVSPETISPGDQVAARVTSDDALKDDWIVVKVTRYDRETNRFEVIDEEPGEDEEGGEHGSGQGGRKYRLGAGAIIALPRRGEGSVTPDFATGSVVLAVYPGTTALYRAQVVGPPRKRKSDDYFLAFDDDEEEGVEGLPQRQVPFYHVVQLPQGHRQ